MKKAMSIRLSYEDIATINTIKDLCGYEGSTQTIRGAIHFYSNYLSSKRDAKLLAYKSVFEATADFLESKGLYDDWRKAVCEANGERYGKSLDKVREQALEGVKTPNKGDQNETKAD